MKEAEMRRVAEWIAAALADTRNERRLAGIHEEVTRFALQYPLFAW
jgi:glycine hydroxymethyltransferase